MASSGSAGSRSAGSASSGLAEKPLQAPAAFAEPLKAHMEDRLLGKLALADSETAASVLALSLESKQVLFAQNVADPVDQAARAAKLYAAARDLSSDVDQPLLAKVEGPAHTHRYRALYSDGTYLLYAEVERAH